jgi:choline dehydrogenase-like flavoprotein
MTSDHKPRSVSRREALRILSHTVCAVPAFQIVSSLPVQASPVDALPDVSRPAFFHSDQFGLVTVLCELIIPGDDHSPGAKTAGVAEYVDELIGSSSEAVQEFWASGLTAIDEFAHQAYNKPFAQCIESDQISMMTMLCVNEQHPRSVAEKFFVALKDALSTATIAPRSVFTKIYNTKGTPFFHHFQDANITNMAQGTPVRPEQFDVCVIGSGPAGGVLAKELAESGAKVALIEAGRRMLGSDFLGHRWPYQMPFRGVREGPQPSAAYPQELATTIKFRDSDSVSLDRIRAVGGRSIHWNADCLSFAEIDFLARTKEGVEEDWPLTYSELAPFYSYVERMIGVTGSREGLDVIPDGEFLPPLKFRCSENIVNRACQKMGIPMIPSRKAVLTVPYDGRPPCHYCGHCMRGCDVAAIFSIPTAMLPKAEKTGNFTLIPDKLVRELLVDDDGSIRSASVIDLISKEEQEISARVFAVCCAVPESARLLLNSRSSRYPNGLANTNDMVGRGLHGTIFGSVSGYLEDLIGTKPVNNDGCTDHAYIPRFNQRLGGRPKYAGGWHYFLNYSGFMYPHDAKRLPGFGKSFKQQVRTIQPGYVFIGAQGKILARAENRVTIDPNQVDAYGIPVPLIRFRYADDDLALWKDSMAFARELLDNSKSKLIFDNTLAPVAFASHETGTVRMGKDPKTSVLNAYCQSHEIKNLFVVGGSAFTTYNEKNPTLTIMALAVRTARFIMDQAKRGSL